MFFDQKEKLMKNLGSIKNNLKIFKEKSEDTK
jgi:hypothetical protein